MILVTRSPAFQARWQHLLSVAPALGMPTGTENERALRDAVRAAPNLTSTYDLITGLLLLRLWAVAAGKPIEDWPAEARKVAEDGRRYFRSSHNAFAGYIPPRLIEYSGLTRADLAMELSTSFNRGVIAILAADMGRQHFKEIRLLGEAHLRDALQAGKGAVLWCEPGFEANLIIKAGLHQAGFAVHHLSRPTHYLARTRLGIRYINQLVRNAEDAYLAERIVLTASSLMPATRRMLDLLAANEVVSITVSSAGSQIIEAPLLGGIRRFATGAPHLALRSGAALLPVFSHREGSGHVVQIDRPIELHHLERQAALQHAAEDFAERQEAHLREHATLWAGFVFGPFASANPGD